MTVVTTTITTKVKFWKSRTFIFGLAFGAIVISVTSAILVVIFSSHETEETKEDNIHWSYADQEHWPGICQSGEMQSPINLTEATSNKTDAIAALSLQNFGYFKDIVVKNDGHSVKVKLGDCDDCTKPTVSGASLIGNYTLDNVHFHWTAEHVINEIQYPLEAHFVFYRDEYGSLDNATIYPYGLAVIGVFFQESNKTTHNGFKTIGNAVQEVSRKAGQSVTSSRGIELDNFFPDDTDKFFRYTGSLTTPNCTETVNWIVFNNPSNISTEDLNDLSNIYTEDDELLEANNRALQNINNRTIYFREAVR